MDRGDLNHWYKRHVGGDKNILSPPTGDTASSGIGEIPRLPSLHPPGSGVTEHSPTQAHPGGILPGLQMTSPAAGSYFSARDSHDQREMLAAAAAAATAVQNYPPFMWPSSLLPHPDLLATQPNPLSTILPSNPLLLSETFPAYLGRHLPTLPEPPSWRNALTSPTSGSAPPIGKINSKRPQHGHNTKLMSPSKTTEEDFTNKIDILSPNRSSDANKGSKKISRLDDEKRTNPSPGEVSPKTLDSTTLAHSVNAEKAAHQINKVCDNQTVNNTGENGTVRKNASLATISDSATLLCSSTSGSESKRVEVHHRKGPPTVESISVPTNSNGDNKVNVKSDVSSICRSNNPLENNIDTDICTAVAIATGSNKTTIDGGVKTTAVLNSSSEIREQGETERTNNNNNKTQASTFDTLTDSEVVLKTKLRSGAEKPTGKSPSSSGIVSRVGDKSGYKKENDSVQIKRKIKCKSVVEDLQEDPDTDIDVGDEMTSCSYQCSVVSNGHGQGDGRRVHATTYTPEVGVAPDLLKSDLSTTTTTTTTTAIDLTTTCSVNKSKQEKTAVVKHPTSTNSSVSSTSSSSVSPSSSKSSDAASQGLLASPSSKSSDLASQGAALVGSQQHSLLTPPNYMSFDPRILSFYTIEEREKLIRGGWIPACYSPTTKELPPVFSPAMPKCVPTGVKMDTSPSLASVTQVSAKKVGVSESKKTSSDNKKPPRDGVSKKGSPPTSTVNTSTIPVGIAIARKRQDTSSERREQERPTTEQARPPTSENIAVPNRTTTGQTTTTSTSGLTSNLVITGGSSEYWLGHGPYSLPPSTREGAQLQYNPPPGYKIAGDPITGQLYVIPDMTRGFGPASPLPSPGSSLKSPDQQHPSLDSTALDRKMTITPLPVLSPSNIHTPMIGTESGGSGRTSRTPSRSSIDESVRGRPGSHDHMTRTSAGDGHRSQESRSSASTVSTPVSGGRDDGRTSAAVSPPFRHDSMATSMANYSNVYPYYPYYWNHSHPYTTQQQQQFSTQVRPPSRTNSNTSTSHPRPSSESGSKSKSTVSVQTLQNSVTEVGIQTCNILVETSVQTDEDQSSSSQGIETTDSSGVSGDPTKCTCSCHDKKEDITEKDETPLNSANKSVSSDNSTDDNTDGLHILSTLASHLDFFTPITVATDDDLSSLYNGPRSSYYDRSSFGGYRRAKTPSSDDTGSVFRFGSDSMVSMEVEVRTRLAEIQRLYKEKQKQLCKLKRKDSEGGQERKHSRTKSRTTSKSQSESDPLSPKAPRVTSPKPMRKTKAQLKYMQHTPVVDFQDMTVSENKDSEMEELRTLFEDTLLDSGQDKAGETGKKSDGSSSSPLGGLSEGPVAFTSTPLSKPERRLKRKSSQGSELSHAKKRKPGRPKKFGKGVTQTLVSKSSKHFSFLNIEDEYGSERETSSSNEEDDNDDWRRRRSERIFLNDKSLVSPVKAEPLPDVHRSLTSKVKHLTKQREASRAKDLSEKVRKKYRNLEPTRKYSNMPIKKEDRPTLSHSYSASSDDLPLTEIKSKITSLANTVKDTSPAITESDLKDSLKILYFMDGLFYAGSLKEIHPPDIYGVHVNGERGNRPHILPREEILENVFLDVRVQDSNELPVGKRICAYWSQQFSCMYPGLVVEGIGLPKTARGRGLVNVEFDDGDTGKISVEHVRLLPQDFPFQGDSDDEPETPNKRRKSIEEKFPESWRERQPLHIETQHSTSLQTLHSPPRSKDLSSPRSKNLSSPRTKDLSSPSSKDLDSPRSKGLNSPRSKDFKRCNSTPTKRQMIASQRKKRSKSTSDRRKEDSEESEISEGEEEEEEEEGAGQRKVKRSPAKKKSVSVSGGQTKANTVLPAHQIWQWQESSRRLASKGKAKRIYYGAIQRGKEVIKVGESAVFLTVGRPNLPYIGRVECFYENRSGNMVVKVKWFYHPEETKGGKKLAEIRGALYESPHGDENDVQTISHKCHVMSYTRYKSYRQTHSANEMVNVYYLAGFYDPTISLIKFEGDVKLI